MLDSACHMWEPRAESVRYIMYYGLLATSSVHICRYSQVQTVVEVWDSGLGHSVLYLLLALRAIIQYHSKTTVGDVIITSFKELQGTGCISDFETLQLPICYCVVHGFHVHGLGRPYCCLLTTQLSFGSSSYTHLDQTACSHVWSYPIAFTCRVLS